MTHKDYILIAAAIKEARKRCVLGNQFEDGVEAVTHEIANACEEQRSQFNRTLFMQASGMDVID